MKYMGYGGAETSKFFTGEKSPVRLTSISPVFSVKMPGLVGRDPSDVIHLKKLVVDSKKGVRKFDTSSFKAFTGHNKVAKYGENDVELEFLDYDSDSFTFRPAGPLEPGAEYAISAGGSLGKSYLFGFDAK
jgi:hypothetical protein